MTEAMRAHLRLLSTIPQDRIRTHTMEPTTIEIPAFIESRKSRREKIEQRKEWFRQNAPHKTQAQLRAESGMSLTAVGYYLKRIGIKAKPCEQEVRAEDHKSWLIRNAHRFTAKEISEKLNIHLSTIRHHCIKLKLTCKSGR